MIPSHYRRPDSSEGRALDVPDAGLCAGSAWDLEQTIHSIAASFLIYKVGVTGLLCPVPGLQ